MKGVLTPNPIPGTTTKSRIAIIFRRSIAPPPRRWSATGSSTESRNATAAGARTSPQREYRGSIQTQNSQITVTRSSLITYRSTSPYHFPSMGNMPRLRGARTVGYLSRVGAHLQGKSVREISYADFAAIVRAGLSETLAPTNAERLELDSKHVDPPTSSLLHAPIEEQERRVVQILMNRKISGR